MEKLDYVVLGVLVIAFIGFGWYLAHAPGNPVAPAQCDQINTQTGLNNSLIDCLSTGNKVCIAEYNNLAAACNGGKET